MRALRWWSCLLAVSGLCACWDGRTSLDRTERKARVDQATLDLGRLEPGVPGEGRVRVTNDGEGLLQVDVTVEPRDGPFVVPFPTLTADSSGADITVRFVAFEEGTFNAVLHIHTNSDVAPADFSVPVTALVALPPPCDDGNPCTLDLRQGGNCEHVPISGTCDDGNTCTIADRCSDGACVGQPLQCDDGVDCTVDACDAQTGCVFMPRHEACEDNNPCTLDVCAPVAGCSNAVAPTGTLCGFPACDAMPLCVDGACVTSRAPDGFPCEDGDPCSLGDTCRAGACQRGAGEPFGVGDPVVAALPEVETGLMDPVHLVGLQPLGNARVRVAVQLAPRCGITACPALEDPCFAPGDEPAPGHLVQLVDVDAAGTRAPAGNIPLPDGHRLVDARGVLTPNGLVVLLRTIGAVDCTSVRAPDPVVTLSVVLVHSNGTTEGPHVVSSLTHDPSRGTVAQTPMALGAQDNGLAIMVGTGARLVCLGACPEAMALQVLALNAAQWPPVEEASNAVNVLLLGGNTQNDAVRDLQVVRFENELHAVWRVLASGSAASCGDGNQPLWTAWRWHAPVDQGLVAAAETLGDGLRSDVDVSLTVGALGPTVFLGRRDVAPEPPPCDADTCPLPACGYTDTVEVQQGGETAQVWTGTRNNLGGPLQGLASGAAFGRAVGVIMEETGTLHLRAPALGPLPEVASSYAPPMDAPVHLNAQESPVLVADGRLGWLGALFNGNLGSFTYGAAAVVLAGCGVQSTGTIRGLPNLDGGIPTPDAAVDVDGGDADGGAPDAGDTDGGATADAGSSAQPDAGGGGVVSTANPEDGGVDGGTAGDAG